MQHFHNNQLDKKQKMAARLQVKQSEVCEENRGKGMERSREKGKEEVPVKKIIRGVKEEKK